MLLYYTMPHYDARLFGDLFCRIAQFGDVPAGFPELETGTGAGPGAPGAVNRIGVAATARYLPTLCRGVDGYAAACDEFDVLDQGQIHHTYGPGLITGHAEFSVREPAIGIQHPTGIFSDLGLWGDLPSRKRIAYLYTDFGTNFGQDICIHN